MTYIQCLIIAIIQGLTEFLPVSSSAHIVFANAFYKFFASKELSFNSQEEIFFAIIIHLGTLIAIFFYFHKDILEILKGFWEVLKTRKVSTDSEKMSLYILLGTIVTVVFVLPIKDIVEKTLSSPYICSLCLILTSIILFASEIVSKKYQNNKPLTFKKSALIGLSQGFAIFPGLSRSGLTISTGLFLGLDKITSAKFSFLLSAPIILASSIFYPVMEIDLKNALSFNFGAIVLGFFVSMIVGYLCIKYFLKFLQKNSMRSFALYCLFMGIFTLWFFKYYS